MQLAGGMVSHYHVHVGDCVLNWLQQETIQFRRDTSVFTSYQREDSNLIEVIQPDHDFSLSDQARIVSSQFFLNHVVSRGLIA